MMQISLIIGPTTRILAAIVATLLLATGGVLYSAEQAGHKSALPVVVEQVENDLALLVDHKVLAASDYWRDHLVEGGKCDGAKVAALLLQLARVFKPAAEASEAVAVLAEHGVIGSPDYWKTKAVAGGTCDAGNVAAVLNRVAARLPMPPPKSLSARPLEPTVVGRLQDSYDVVVAGAGTGGCGAAIQAARMGRSVLLLEETDWIGGQMTAAAVTSMDEGVTLVRERGLYRELCGLIAAYYQPLGINYETAYWHSHVCVEPRVGRTLLHKMLADARGSGVLDLVLRSRVTKVRRQGDVVTGVQIACVTPSGQVTRSVGSKVLIDATEWGDVIPLTSARYRAGNCTSDAIDPKRHIQDITWTAVVKQYPQGVPPQLRLTAPPPGYDAMVAHFRKSLQAGDSDKLIASKEGQAWTWGWFIGYRGMPDSARPPQGRSITRTHLNFNNDYPATVADLENPARRLATVRAAMVKTLDLLYYIQTELGKRDWSVANDEGYDTPYNRAQIDAFIAAQPELKPYRDLLIHFPVMPYARESRRIIGLHTLTAREIERKPGKPVQFPNTVAIGDYAVDLHGSMTPPYLELDLDRAEDIPHKWADRGMGPFAIPLECFIPEKVDGFLPAEKNLSQSRLASGATRLQPHTLLMGQAAGAIAALAVEHHVQPRALDPVLVQRALLDAGCTLTIDRVNAPWGSEKWKSRQLEILHSGR
jgi:hypothetical protein